MATPNEVTENKEEIRIIWLDENNSSECLLQKTSLLELNQGAQFYSDFNRCFDLIKTVQEEKIFLIYSGDYTQHFSILTNMYNHPNLLAIFIVGAVHQDHHSFMEKYKKIVGIFTDQESLLNAIREKINIVEKHTLKFDTESKSYLRYQMLVYTLQQIPRDEQSIQQMLDICRDYYQYNKYELKKIEEFKEKYNRENAIEWYTDYSFIYKLLNKALHTKDIELLYVFRSFIFDLCAAIEQKSQGSMTVYYGTQMSMEEIEKLKDNLDKIISPNGFLLASRNVDKSIQSTRSQFMSQSVLFEIQVDPSISFADIKANEEVLFNLNIIFKINSVNFDSTLNLWKIQLTTSDDNTQIIEEQLLTPKRELQQSSPIIYLGNLMMNDNRIEKYFNMLLKTLPSNHPDITDVYINIGNIYFDKDQFDIALKNYEKAYELYQQQPSIANPLQGIANVHSAKGNHDLALDYYKTILNDIENKYPDDNEQKAITLDSIGRVYGDKDDFNTALVYLFRALKIYKRLLNEPHQNIAKCLGQIGNIYENKGDLAVALDYYYQRFNMLEQCLSFDHPNLITSLQLIVEVYKKMGNMEKALEFCQEKLDIQKNKWGDNHCNTIRALMMIANVLKTDAPSQALEYYEKIRSIPLDLQTSSECIKSIASLYAYFSMYDKALECELEVLNIYQQILRSDHIDIATSLRNIGICYVKMGKPSETLRYFNESLAIFKANFDEEHGEIQRLLTDIIKIKNIVMFEVAYKSSRKHSKGKPRHR